jgi:hypothetical protein
MVEMGMSIGLEQGRGNVKLRLFGNISLDFAGGTYFPWLVFDAVSVYSLSFSILMISFGIMTSNWQNGLDLKDEFV